MLMMLNDNGYLVFMKIKKTLRKCGYACWIKQTISHS